MTFEMMCIMSSAVTTTSFSSRSSRHLFRMRIELFFRLLLLVAKRGGFLKILCFDRSFLFHAESLRSLSRCPSRRVAASWH